VLRDLRHGLAIRESPRPSVATWPGASGAGKTLGILDAHPSYF